MVRRSPRLRFKLKLRSLAPGNATSSRTCCTCVPPGLAGGACGACSCRACHKERERCHTESIRRRAQEQAAWVAGAHWRLRGCSAPAACAGSWAPPASAASSSTGAAAGVAAAKVRMYSRFTGAWPGASVYAAGSAMGVSCRRPTLASSVQSTVHVLCRQVEFAGYPCPRRAASAAAGWCRAAELS